MAVAHSTSRLMLTWMLVWPHCCAMAPLRVMMVRPHLSGVTWISDQSTWSSPMRGGLP